jgi:hypothetical protein
MGNADRIKPKLFRIFGRTAIFPPGSQPDFWEDFTGKNRQAAGLESSKRSGPGYADPSRHLPPIANLGADRR